MSDETLRILKLLESGKITSQEAEGLLAAIKEPAAPVGDDDEFLYHGANPARIVARVMDEVNPGLVAAEAMERAREKMELARERMERHRERHIHFRIPRVPKVPRVPDIPKIVECCFGSHSAEEEQVVTVPAEGIRALSLSQPRSEISVTGNDTDQIVIKAQVQVYGDDEGEAQERLKSLKVVAENDGGTLRVKLEGPPWTKKRRAQVDFELEVPKGLALELGTASGEIEVAGNVGGAKINSASGEVSLDGCSGTIEISTASGDIELAKCIQASVKIQTASGDIEAADFSGEFAAQSVSGDVSLKLDRGRAEVSTVSGDLELEAGSLEGLAASTTSGDISIELRSSPGGEMRLASVSGDIELEIPDDSDISLEASTASGDIDCGLELAERNQTSRRLTGRLGEGRVTVAIKTTSGDISVE
jgi:DUF4097 and DUF4098 domain-containing protein YvlB